MEDEVTVVHPTCQVCLGENGSLLTLASCQHVVHLACCPSGDNDLRHRSCPLCSTELTWLDYAKTLNKAEFLLLAFPIDLKLESALTKFNAFHHKQTSSSSASATPRGRKRVKRSSAASSNTKKATYWANGTGFGGTSGELPQTQRKAMLKQQESTDAKWANLFQAIDPPASTLNLDVFAEFVRVCALFLVNGPTDVNERAPVYLALLECLFRIASKCPGLLPLLLPQVRKEDDDEEEEEENSSSGGIFLLALVSRLGDGLEKLNPSLSELCANIVSYSLSWTEKHPLYSLEEVKESLKLTSSRAAIRSQLEEALSSGTHLEAAYKSSLQPLAFRTICLLEMAAQRMCFHSLLAQQQMHHSGYAAGGGGSGKARLHRIHSELATLQSSLPVEWNSSIFCVVDEDRMDVMQFLIVGPEGTPYENGCFLFDCILPDNYPQVPPTIVIQTTGGGRIRFNPNLYHNGKVCLSLLNTWSGPSWDPKSSTLLQVLISIQSLIMNGQPFFNEPGRENQPGMEIQSQQYNALIRFHTVRLAMVEMMQTPPHAFERIVRVHFALKRTQILEQLVRWLTEFTVCPFSSELPRLDQYEHVIAQIKYEVEKNVQVVMNKPNMSSSAAAVVSLLDDDDDEEEDNNNTNGGNVVEEIGSSSNEEEEEEEEEVLVLD